MSDLAPQHLTPKHLWWTANELADAGLPDMPGTRQSIERWVKRTNLRGNPALARRRAGRGGGWEYHWSALPLSARKSLLAVASVPVVAPDRGATWDWFEGLPVAAQARARDRLRCVQSVEALEVHLTRDLAVREVASAENVSPRTLWTWLSLVEGVRTDDRLPALAPRHRAAVRKGSRAEFDEAFFDWMLADYLRLAGPSFSSCYRRAVTVARDKRWVVAPERTMRRYLDTRVSQPVQVLARKGVDALKRLYPPQTRDKTALHALEVVNGDYHRFDVFVRWPGIETPVRPQMVAFQDVYSGRVLAWRLDLTANSHTVKLAAGDMVEEWGIPNHVLLDNGREFAAKLITGGAKTRFRFKIREDDLPGLFVSLGCEIHWATPYAGQSKPIERAFRDMCDAIARDPRFDGAWTGNRPDAQPEDYGSRAIPFEDFLRIVGEGIEEHNLRRGRRSEVAWGRSFAEVFAESYERAPIRKATEAQRRLWLMGAEGLRADTSSGLLRLMGNEYWSDWMHEIAGDRVIARFDPADLQAGLHVYSADNRYLGEAACKLAAGFLSVEDARAHAKARGDWMKAERKALAAHRTLTARELGVDLDTAAGLEPAPKPQAKVVRLVTGPKVGPAPSAVPNPALEAAQAALVTDLAARRAAPVDTELPRDRFRRALDLEGSLKRGDVITPEQERWLRGYQSSAEYRASARVHAEYGDSYFG